MLERDLDVSADEALGECLRRGLVVRSLHGVAGDQDGRHWHLGLPGRAGTLELTDCAGRVWLKVHPRRDGGWASALADELARRQPRASH